MMFFCIQYYEHFSFCSVMALGGIPGPYGAGFQFLRQWSLAINLYYALCYVLDYIKDLGFATV